jgi:hypothetical protein
VLAQLPSGEQVVTYADNILVFGRDRTEALARAQNLARALENSPAMPLRSRIGRVASFAVSGLPSESEVEFAHQTSTAHEGHLSWAPTADRRFDLPESISGQMTEEVIVRMEHRVARWRRAYPTWREGQQWETECLALLAGARYFRDGQPLHLAAAVNAIIAALVACQSSRQPQEFVPDPSGNAELERRHARLISEVSRFLNESALAA